MAKNVDFKQLMLEKGEKIGVGAAAAFMLLLVVIGAVSGFNSDKPADIAKEIKDRSSQIEAKLASGPPNSPKEINPNLLKDLNANKVPLGPHLNKVDFFTETALEDNKRKRPDILTPVGEASVEVLRVPVKVLIVSPQGDHLRVGVKTPKAKPKEDSTPKGQDPRQYMMHRFAGQQFGRRMPRFQNAAQYVEFLRRMQMGDAAKDEFDLDLVDSQKIDKNSKLASTVQPQRMIVVSAAFPYRAQFDAFRIALKAGSLKELGDQKPQFLPFNVQRRALDGNGKVKEPWADLDLVGNYASAFRFQFGSEDEDPSLHDVIFKGQGLIMSRPQLARGDYGRPKLPLIDEALGELLKSKNDKPNAVLVTPLQKQVQGFNPFDSVAPVEEEKGPKKIQPMLKTEPGKAGDTADLIVPKFCLVRFIDADDKLKPGMTYQYRLQIKTANPNYGAAKEKLAYPSLADDKELTSAWWPPEDSKQVIQAKVTPEFYYYGVELDDKAETEKKKRDPNLYRDSKDLTFLQAHRWLDKVRLNPEVAGTQVPVGDWSVCDIPVRRCEYVIRTEPVDLPIWSPAGEAYRMAVPPAPPKAASPLIRQPKASTGIPVTYAPLGEPDLLVDFEGGKVRQSFRPTEKGRSIDVREDAAVEYLIMKADGSLIVRNSRTDAKDSTREKRYTQWKKQVDETKGGKKGKSGGNDPF